MVSKDLKKGESLKAVTIYTRTPATGSNNVPTAYLTSFTGWTQWGILKEAPTFSQPLSTNDIDYADLGAKITTVSRDSVTINVPAGQIEDVIEAIFFSGGGDADLSALDILVDYTYQRNLQGRQLFFPDAYPTNLDDYQPSKSDGSVAAVTFSSDTNARLNGRSYAHFRQTAA